MAYFKSNEQEPETAYSETAQDETEYDDGFDDLYETAEEVPELSREEKAERTRNRLKLAFGAGNLFGVMKDDTDREQRNDEESDLSGPCGNNTGIGNGTGSHAAFFSGQRGECFRDPRNRQGSKESR